MNINSINVGLTGENLLSIYNDFVSIKEIDIKKVEINDDIKIIGSFSKGVIIKFEVKVKNRSRKTSLIVNEESTQPKTTTKKISKKKVTEKDINIVYYYAYIW